MTITLQAVNELIASLESAGEPSIREQKFLKLAKAYQRLAAENVALKSAVTKQIELRSEIKKAGRPPHADFWVQSICEAEDRVSKALNGTPATDRIVAGIKADGVEEFIGRLQQLVDEGDFVGDEVAVIVGAIDCGKEFCAQLREGADK
ncbi:MULTISPECIES: hypothetical protein [Klebsiella pneumoniae complex]|uniref:hypothetical protein n=1 Tax=Klebsiella pneumoniae complex TaxID=3390273 RepID=UPI00164B7790|nr:MULTISPECIES: hypothetical protein [Klebsiella]MBC4641752.1 hypothetical protein [Klebsiella quasipneumoniae]MBC4693678.1 hypothetical protein [Klebsiella quasipneumoniae]MBC4720359.1 hypothetical protein [Klebsiella quasipneumoniae]MCY0496900.1 hypothetical protein [Klebsiella pneumoniae]MDL4002827.1 hypothetical protein [Klebsiella quasipneumoniae]